jgi:hypothetical protein
MCKRFVVRGTAESREIPDIRPHETIKVRLPQRSQQLLGLHLITSRGPNVLVQVHVQWPQASLVNKLIEGTSMVCIIPVAMETN